jgi:S1-C subfamily serine protease
MFKFFSSLGALAFLFLMLAFGHGYYEVNKQPTIAHQLESVVSIYSNYGENYCSGWVKAGTHTIVTAAHCIPDGDMTAVVVVDFGDGTMHPFHVEYAGKLTDDGNERVPDLMTLTTNDPSVKWPAGFDVCLFKPFYGESVELLGGPLGDSKTASFGSISNPGRELPNLDPNDHTAFLQYDGFLFPGNSGGPVLDRQLGCVVGSAEMLQNAVPGVDYPYGVPFLVPISELDKVVPNRG